jgi:uncharacterized membrane protein
MSGWALMLIEIPLCALGFYMVGLVAIIPGIVIGKMMERTNAPQWANHLAIFVLGMAAWGLVFGTHIA